MAKPDIAASFGENGYIVVESAIAAPHLSSLRGAARGIVEEFDVAAHRSVFSTLHEDRDRDQYFIDSAEAVHCFLEEGALRADGQLDRPKEKAINKIGHAMHDLVPEFRDFCRLPIFAKTLTALGMQQAALWQSMYIFKQPKIGGEVRWHQDASYLIGERGGESRDDNSPAVIGAWIAMEDADRGNGCLWVQPGGHRSPLREVYEVLPGSPTGALRKLDATPWPVESEALALEVPAGSVIFFSDHMPHYSSQNRSERSRQAFTMHMTGSGTTWSPRNWLQRRTFAPFYLS